MNIDTDPTKPATSAPTSTLEIAAAFSNVAKAQADYEAAAAIAVEAERVRIQKSRKLSTLQAEADRLLTRLKDQAPRGTAWATTDFQQAMAGFNDFINRAREAEAKEAAR